jgi:hypothetical protein
MNQHHRVNISVELVPSRLKCTDCGKEFKYQSKYDEHKSAKRPCGVREITPEQQDNPDRCDYCNNIFSSKSNLTKHMAKCRLRLTPQVVVDQVTIDDQLQELHELIVAERRKRKQQVAQLKEQIRELAAMINAQSSSSTDSSCEESSEQPSSQPAPALVTPKSAPNIYPSGIQRATANFIGCSCLYIIKLPADNVAPHTYKYGISNDISTRLRVHYRKFGFTNIIAIYNCGDDDTTGITKASTDRSRAIETALGKFAESNDERIRWTPPGADNAQTEIIRTTDISKYTDFIEKKLRKQKRARK